MPADGIAPNRTEAVAAELESARVALVRQLQGNPDWVAYRMLVGAGGDAPAEQQQRLARLERRLASVPTFLAYERLTAAIGLLGGRWAASDNYVQVSSATIVPKMSEAAPSPSPMQLAPVGPDDLTRIRGIDTSMTPRLEALGITRFAQIAAWEADDVRLVADALGFGRAFLNNNVVEQARDLARAAVSPCAEPRLGDGPVVRSIAHWHVRDGAPSTASQTPFVSPPTAATLAEARARLARGVSRKAPVSLAELLPAIAAPIVIGDVVADPIPEASWHPAPLLVSPWPHEQTSAIKPAPAPPPAKPVEPAPQPTAVNRIAAEPPTALVPLPAHEDAVVRLDDIERDIDLFGAPEPGQPQVAPAARELVRTAPPRRIRPAVEALPEAIADVEEAEVQIVVGRRRAGVLEPVADLPLQPKRLIAAAEASRAQAEAVTAGSVDVAEAAVVIVRRRGSARAAPELAFYRDRAEPADSLVLQVQGA